MGKFILNIINCGSDLFLNPINTMQTPSREEKITPNHMNTEEIREWEEEFREYFDKTLKTKKPSIEGLDRELLINFIKNIEDKAHQQGVQETKERAVKVVRENTKGNFTIDELVEAINKI